MNWEMIEHMCISIAVVGAALSYIYRGFKFAKKPSDNINEKLDRDYNRLNKHDEEFEYISKAIAMLLRSDMIMLGHLRTGNNTGKISSMEKELQEFLINN